MYASCLLIFAFSLTSRALRNNPVGGFPVASGPSTGPLLLPTGIAAPRPFSAVPAIAVHEFTVSGDNPATDLLPIATVRPVAQTEISQPNGGPPPSAPTSPPATDPNTPLDPDSPFQDPNDIAPEAASPAPAPAPVPAPAPAPASSQPPANNQPQGQAPAPVPALPAVLPPASGPSTTVVDNVPIVSSNSHIIVGSQTLAPGAVVTFAGKTISLAPSAAGVVIGSSTVALPAPTPAVTPAPVITYNGQTITANQQSAFVIGSQTLSSGQDITVDGTAIHYGSGNVVIGGSTQTLETDSGTVPLPTETDSGAGTATTLSTSTASQTGGSGSTKQNKAVRRGAEGVWLWLGTAVLVALMTL